MGGGCGNILDPDGALRTYRRPWSGIRWSDVKALLGASFAEWNKHNGPRLGASLAFYTLLSLAPLLLVVISIGGLAFGRQAAQGQIIWQIRDLIGPQGADVIQAVFEGSRKTTQGILASALGILTLFFGATGVLIELRGALNTVWEVPPAPLAGARTITALIKERLFSFALVLSIGFLLLVSLAVSAILSALGTFASQFLPASPTLLQIVNSLVSFIAATGLFAAIYRFLPDVRIEWRDVLLGAAVTSLLFTTGKWVISLYLGKATFASTYGAAASLVVLMVWVYYSGQIFFLGAEFTRAFANRYGSQPNRYPGPMVVESTGVPPGQ